jgi:hypothetical protein
MFLIPNKISKWVILEDGKFNIVWDSITSAFYMISLILIPFVISTDVTVLDNIQIVELLIDIYLAIDIFVNFFTSYTSDVERVTDLKAISYHYLTTGFIFDLFGTLPGLVTAEFVWQVYYFKLLRYAQIKRPFRQIRFILEKIDYIFSSINK